MTAAELQLVIKAKDQSKATFAIVKGRLTKFKAQVSKVSDGFKSLSTKFSTAMTSIAKKAKWAALMVGAALTAMVVTSIKQFARLESGLLDVQKTTGMADEEIQKLRKQLENLVLVTRGMTMEGLLNASAIAGQLGIRGVKDIGIFSKTVEMMAIATKYTAEEAALDLAKIAKVMDLPIAKSEKLGDVMNELSNRTTAFATQVGEITKRAGSMGKSFGLTIPEMMGFAATMIDVGKTSQIGATAITRLLNQALLDTRGFAHVSGIEFNKYAKMMKAKPLKAIEAFLKGLGELDKFKRMETLKELQLSGVRVAPALVAMSENTKLLTANIKIANDQWRKGGSLMKEYKNRARGLSSAFISIWEAVKIMAARLGDVFAPALKKFADQFQKQIKAVKDYVDQSKIVKAFQDIFGEIMESMTKHLNILGWVKKTFGQTPEEVRNNLEKWKAKFMEFKKWLETNSPLEFLKEAFKTMLSYVKWIGAGIGILVISTNLWAVKLAGVYLLYESIVAVSKILRQADAERLIRLGNYQLVQAKELQTMAAGTKNIAERNRLLKLSIGYSKTAQTLFARATGQAEGAGVKTPVSEWATKLWTKGIEKMAGVSGRTKGGVSEQFKKVMPKAIEAKEKRKASWGRLDEKYWLFEEGEKPQEVTRGIVDMLRKAETKGDKAVNDLLKELKKWAEEIGKFTSVTNEKVINVTSAVSRISSAVNSITREQQRMRLVTNE